MNSLGLHLAKSMRLATDGERLTFGLPTALTAVPAGYTSESDGTLYHRWSEEDLKAEIKRLDEQMQSVEFAQGATIPLYEDGNGPSQGVLAEQ